MKEFRFGTNILRVRARNKTEAQQKLEQLLAKWEVKAMSHPIVVRHRGYVGVIHRQFPDVEGCCSFIVDTAGKYRAFGSSGREPAAEREYLLSHITAMAADELGPTTSAESA